MREVCSGSETKSSGFLIAAPGNAAIAISDRTLSGCTTRKGPEIRPTAVVPRGTFRSPPFAIKEDKLNWSMCRIGIGIARGIGAISTVRGLTELEEYGIKHCHNEILKDEDVLTSAQLHQEA
jgi:hypothetical protein